MNYRLLVQAGLATALAFILMIAGTGTTRAQTFNPQLNVVLEDPTPGANSSFTTDFNLPEGDVQFAGVVTFIPAEWTIAPGEQIAIGAVVGELTAQATLGLINAACNNALPVHFIMLNASIDITDTVPFLDVDDNGTEDYAENRDESSLQDGFEKYPDFLTRALADENDQPLQPIRRAAGIGIVAGTNVLLQFLVFEPGTFIDERIPDDASLGYPSVVTLQNAGDPAFDPEPGPITDFCTPLTSNNTAFAITKDNPCTDVVPVSELDPVCEVISAPLELTEDAPATDPDEGGIAQLTNPKDSTYKFTVIGVGQRDTDSDGIENSLDTCAFEPNEGDPRVNGDGDEDLDGLDSGCDPEPNVTNSDQDSDGYLNRGDNCPLDANGEDEADIPAVGNQRDTDDDVIGDACDPDPDDADAQGDLIVTQTEFDLVVGSGTGEPGPWEDGGTVSDGGSDDGGGGSGLIIVIVVVVIAAVLVVGGGGFFLMRRGRGGGAT